MRDELSPQAPVEQSDTAGNPPAFAPAGRTTVLTTPYGQATNRTSVMDAVHADSPTLHSQQSQGTEELSPVNAEAESATPAPAPTAAASSADDAANPDSAPLESDSSPAAQAETPAADASTAEAAQGETEPRSDTEPRDETEPPTAAALADEVSTDTAIAPVTQLSPATETSTAVGNQGEGNTPTDSETSRGKRRRWPLWAGAAAALVILAGGGASYAYASHYSDLAVPRTTVGGVSVSGMSQSEIATLVKQRAAAAKVSTTGAVSNTASLTDLGTKVDANATAAAALKASGSFWSQVKSLFTGNQVAVVSSQDLETATAYVAKLNPQGDQAPVDATVTLAADGASFTTTPAQDGSGLDPKVLTAAAQKAANTLSKQTVATKFVTVAPAVSDAAAKQVADQANQVVAQEIKLTSPDGSQSFTPDAPTKASWLEIKTDTKGLPTVAVNEAKINEWVSAQGANLNKEPVTGVRNVNSAGQVVQTRVEAVDGMKVSNAADLVKQITSALDARKAFDGAFTTETIKATWDEKRIADGAENLAYPAAEGEKWIDINLTKRTVTAYEGATVVHGPVTVVDGRAVTPTVTGTYKVYLKYASQTMRGRNVDGTPYVTENVPWVSYFTGSYALHGAPWWSSWGFSGSHGCINMPVSEAKWIYDWAPVGTPVVSHR